MDKRPDRAPLVQMPALQKPIATRKSTVDHAGMAGEVTGLSVGSSLTSHLRSVMGLMLKSLTRPRSWYICSKQLSICGNRVRGERSGVRGSRQAS